MNTRIATWNVNSIRARLPNVMDWLASSHPDILLLQEIKCQDADFPLLELESSGYRVLVHGQKSYNGVAILSKRAAEDVRRGLPGDDTDPQARYLEATIDGIRVASLYLPNGNPSPGEKFDYKLAWMRRLVTHARTLLSTEMPVVLGGDYNVCPTDDDVYNPAAWQMDALCRPETRSLFREMLNLGLTEAFRSLHAEKGRYSFWDYQAGAWQRDEGLRIDHLLLSPQAADRLVACDIDKAPRGREKASDHTPVWIELR
ncbi:exodeoxyribonuclease III [Paramagnetospirillum kuznetsovii]|uniref:Exodeoxyribonuclease III n=1 Tax=Paramagnetospirillum kuznetsovii TaxID=2053833 RepID=A0A364NZY4_9PROT|nr:exodeoxyribonuclease III [Paramagnetospirillum kuznetsovii]RAU22652.1 exodeoxyribonuclease III [Paramagnetospirillum kuznetsovii]